MRIEALRARRWYISKPPRIMMKINTTMGTTIFATRADLVCPDGGGVSSSNLFASWVDLRNIGTLDIHLYDA
jgi:hypothetical protein